jgi:heat shock protein HslJ
MMACEVGMEQEQAFLGILENAASYRLGLGALDITTADGSSMLRFSAQHLTLENVRWRLASINGASIAEGVVATVLFTPAGTPANQGEENSITGGGGCNTFSGSYSLTDETFTAGPFSVTQSACDEAVMQVEGNFLAGLESAQNYQITLNQLIINTASGSLLLYADRMPLEGPLWVLAYTGPIDNPQPPLAGSEFTARFDRQFGAPAGVMSGGTGCRNYAATYYASPDAIKVNLPQADQVACSDAQTEAEQGYFLGLNSARDYRIIGNELFVYYDTFVHIFAGSYPTVVEDGPLAPLDGTQWWLTSIDTFLVVPGTEVTLLFDINPDGRTGTVSGSGGCNQYSAGITDVFVLSPISATSALCDTPAGIMEQETAYFNALGAANGVFLEGDTLRITTPLETLFFSSVGPAPEQPLPPTPTPEFSLDLPITAVINAPLEGQVDQPIAFDGSSSTANVDIASYAWTFSDGFTAEGAVIEHSFTEAGSYDVILRVTDVEGNVADASIVVVIQ